MILRRDLIVLIFLLSGDVAFSQDISTLQLAQVLFRHGDRTPTHVYDNDPYKPYWKEIGKGALTQIGMEQHYELGGYFRQRYTGYLNTTYRAKDIYVRSTDVDRTLMSASCNLAGLYPPTGDQIWNKNIPWQPIPIHTIPQDNDWLHVDVKCKLYTKLVDEALATPEAQNLLAEYKDMFEYAQEHSGKHIKTFDDASELYSCLKIEKLKNMTWPDWVTDDVFQQLAEVNIINWDYMFPDAETRRLRGGPILGELSTNMANKVTGDNDYLLQVYSAHDTTVTALLTVLQIWDGIPVPYTATVIVELHDIDDEYYVQISYRNSTAHEPFVLTIPGCQELCPMKTFKDLTADLIPDDVTKECKDTTDNSINRIF